MAEFAKAVLPWVLIGMAVGMLFGKPEKEERQ